MKKLLFIIPLAISSLTAYQGQAQTAQYWDNNGASAATGGTWDETSSFWAPSATLTGTPTTFADGNFAIFAAGSTAITTLNINLPGTVNCEGIGNATTTAGAASGARVETLNISGTGSINLPTGSWPFECGNYSSSDIINVYVSMTGPGGIVQHNSGAIGLYGNNSYTGGTTATGGQIIYYNNNNSFGTGTISITGGGTSLWCTNGLGDIVTLANAISIASGNTLNFVNGNTICTGPMTLAGTVTLKNASAPSTNLTVSGVISGSAGAGLTLGAVNGGTIILSGANTYSGPTAVGLTSVPAIVSVSSINSVSTPAQQASSSLGDPSSAANGTIQMGSTTYASKLVYTGAGETSDRVINLASTTGGATIEMDGTGPLNLTSSFTATGGGSKTLTLQGTSTAANTIAGVIPNNSSANKTALTKAQAGSWTLSGKNTFTGNTAISGGTLTIGGAGDLGNGSYSGTISISSGASLIYNSSSGDTLSGVISGAGAIDEEGTSASTLTISGTANTFTGLFNITSGTLAIDGDLSLGAVPGSVVANAITLNGGPGANLRANANNITISANRGITLGANGGAIQVAGNDTCTYNGIISGSGQFQDGVSSSVGLGVLVLGGQEAYTNTTVIAAGTLRLANTASIGNSSGIVMSNSPTLDVSADSPFDLSTTNTFTAIGGSNTAPPVIFGASGGDINFGSQTVNLSFNPAFTSGDGTHSALTISQGTLVLDGNTINVTNASGLTLDVGDYALIQSSNAISITTAPVLNYVGPAMVANTTPSLVTVGNNLVLRVAPGSGYAGAVFSNQNPDPSLTEVYGTANATFSGTVSASGSYPNSGESVNIAIGTIQTNTTTIDDSTGDFTMSVPINEVPVGTYAITYSYPGTNSTLNPATDSSTALTITKAPLTVTANAETKTYGTILPTTGNTQFTPSGLQNGETIGSVTVAYSGSPSGAISNAPVAGSPYTITPSAATGGTFSSGNYSITYVTGQLTINPRPIGLKGTRAYDGTDTAIFSILSITNVVGTDVVNIASGSVTLASATPGSEPVADATGLTLGGPEAGDYTTTAATGAVNITPATDSTNIVAAAAGNTLTLSWPVDHTGWMLQAQTNTLTTGITTAGWVNVPASTNSDQIVIPVDPNNGCVFYRLVYP